MENQSSSQTRESTKLRDRPKLKRPNLFYADLHSEIIKNEDNGIHPDQRVERKLMESEELVKHMSNLPSYLERGENFQEKAFNVGVLDWQRLEKWQYTHKQIPQRSNGCLPSGSNTSSSFSTDGSSTTRSRRGHSSSPSHQRTHRPTLQAHLKASPKDGDSQAIKSVIRNVGKFQDAKCASSNPFNKHHSEIKIKERKGEDLGPHIFPEAQTSSNLRNYGAKSLLKGKMKIQDGEYTEGTEKLQGPYHNTYDHEIHDCPENHEKIVLLFPRDDSENSHCAISLSSDSKAINGRRSIEASRKSFSDGIFPGETYQLELCSNIPHSCPLPCDVKSIEHSQIKQPTSIDAKKIEFSSEPSESSAKISTCPSKSKNPEEKKSTTMSTKSTVVKSSKGSDLNTEKVVATKERNLSPFRRISTGMGRIVRSSISKGSSEIPQLSSKHVTGKSGSEGPVGPTCSDNSSTDRPNSRSRGQSSPLRRLLDPLLNTKAANSQYSAEPSQKDPKSNGPERSSSRGRSSPLRRLIDPFLKPKTENSHCSAEPSRKDSTNGRVESSAVQSLKEKLDFANCRLVNVDDPHHDKNHVSSKVQALLQIVIKNELPLFTFAFNNKSEILAATMKKLSTSEKDHNRWIYTFFTVCEVKKKNGLMTRGGKGKGKDHGYVPNVVAQMKVSDSKVPKLIKNNSTDQFSIREFVLFAVDPKQPDQQTSDLRPKDELAAIVVKLPKEPLLEVQGYSESRVNDKNGFYIGTQDFFSTTVILPGGVHGLSVKGEPSPLLERWKSGGLCDCGGWDIGCRIRVFANQIQLGSSKLKPSKAQPIGGYFELFSQEEEVDNRPVFSLSPFKEGVFSVEFNSSLTLLQAFAVCVSVLNSKKPFELSGLGNLFEEKLTDETHDRIKGSNRAQVTSCPPDSPVGRV